MVAARVRVQVGALDYAHSMAEVLAQLSRVGFKPNTVIDVGVGYGTADLYAAYPDAHFVLIEPVAEFKHAIDRWRQKYDMAYIQAAASENDGTLEIGVYPGSPEASSIFRTADETGADKRRVRTIRLDSIDSAEPPVLLKIDAQGAELSALKGATGILDRIEVVLLEIGTGITTADAAPEFAEVICWMKQHGFVIYDLFGPVWRPLDGALVAWTPCSFAKIVFFAKDGDGDDDGLRCETPGRGRNRRLPPNHPILPRMIELRDSGGGRTATCSKSDAGIT